MKNYMLILAILLIGSTAFSQTTWYEIPTGTDKKLNSIDFPSSNVGYIVGNDTTILKTTNGGQTWAALGLNGIFISSGDDDFTDVKFIDENTGFLVSGYTGVWKTTDGALSWTQASTAMCFPYTVFPTSGLDYLVGGGDCFQGARIDVVANGTSTPANISANFWSDQEKVVEMSFANSTRGLAAVRNEYMLRTVDGGNNWDTISTGVGINSFLTSVVMVNDTLCYAGYSQTDAPFGTWGLLTSNDGGLTWGYDTSTANFLHPSYLSICASQSGKVYAGASFDQGPGGLIFEVNSISGAPYQNVDHPINGMTSHGSNITFGVGDSGYVVVNTPVAELGFSSIDQLDFHIYPNPVQNEFTIDNPHNENMEIVILDPSGRILKTDSLLPGSTKIDCSQLKTGIYFIQVKVDDQLGMKQFVKSN